MGGVLARTVGHFWPDLRPWMDGLHDPRDPNRITYPARCLTWAGLLVFLLKLGSRRQIRFELDSPTALENLNRLAGCRQDRVPHGDTLNYLLGRLAPGELEGLRRRMVHRLRAYPNMQPMWHARPRACWHSRGRLCHKGHSDRLLFA